LRSTTNENGRFEGKFKWSSDGKYIFMLHTFFSGELGPKFFAFPIDPSAPSMKDNAKRLEEKANQVIDRYLNHKHISGFDVSSDGRALVILRAGGQAPFIVSL
jgi:hypothetical protein